MRMTGSERMNFLLTTKYSILKFVFKIKSKYVYICFVDRKQEGLFLEVFFLRIATVCEKSLKPNTAFHRLFLRLIDGFLCNKIQKILRPRFFSYICDPDDNTIQKNTCLNLICINKFYMFRSGRANSTSAWNSATTTWTSYRWGCIFGYGICLILWGKKIGFKKRN